MADLAVTGKSQFDCLSVWVHLSFAKDTNVNFVLQSVCQGCVLLVLDF